PQQTDRLSDRVSKWVIHLSFDGVDLPADLARDVPGHELVDLINARKHADLLVAEVDVRMDEELLRKLDDRPVRTTDVFARSTRVSSSPPTSSFSFSCEVTTSHMVPRPTRPRLWTTAWRSSIFCTSRATNWPTSSMTKTSDWPGFLRFISSLQRSARSPAVM